MKKFLNTLLFLLSVHVAGLFSFSLFRVVKFIALHDLESPAARQASAFQAFLRGVWFDNVVCCYLLIVPLVVVLLAASFGKYQKGWLKGAVWFFGIFYPVCFMAAAADVPYFSFFFKDINSSIFGWFGYAGTTAGMVFQETSFYFYILLFLLMCVAFVWGIVLLRRYFARRIETAPAEAFKWKTIVPKTLLTLALGGLCLFGIRGRTGYNPIKVSEAYYCNDSFLNQLGINPFFNLLTSTLDDMRAENKRLELMPDREAVAFARSELNANGTDSLHPLLRTVTDIQPMQKRNVVFILMESMSGSLIHSFGQPEELTPTLDSLYRSALVFTNFYSSGIHTNHGITASLYSMPAIMKRNLMKGTVTPHRDGLPTILKQNGYHNLFFMTHESQYDNMNAFLRTNGYDEIFSKENYPSNKVVNSFGVPDDFLFSYALPVLRRTAQMHRPFFATLLTISNHPPFVIPKNFKARSAKPETQIVEYADKCLGDFIRAAQREPWYKNTVFVLVADHGKMVGKGDAELPQCYNHIPLFMFGPGVPKGQYTGLGEQVDIVPTVLGLLHTSYRFDGFGVDLFKTKRSKVFYSADNVIVARDAAHCYLYNPSTHQSFSYNVGSHGELNVVGKAAQPSVFEQLKHYVFGMLQTAEYIYGRDK